MPNQASPPELTYGMAHLGRDVAPGSGAEQDAIAVVRDLLENSSALIDTSNNYAEGRSEEIIGAALAQCSTNQQHRVITKVDRDATSHAFDRDRVLASFEESLRRLGVDRLSLVHLHDPYSVTFDEAMSPRGAVSALLTLKDAGLIDQLGIAAGPPHAMRPYVESGAFDAVLCHNRYNLIDRTAEPLFTEAKRRGMTVFNAAPFGANILAMGPRPEATFAYLPTPTPLRAWVERVQRLCDEHGVSLRALALDFSLRSPLVDSTVIGATTIERRTQTEALRTRQVPLAVYDDLAAIGPAPTTIDDTDPRRIQMYLGMISPAQYWASTEWPDRPDRWWA